MRSSTSHGHLHRHRAARPEGLHRAAQIDVSDQDGGINLGQPDTGSSVSACTCRTRSRPTGRRPDLLRHRQRGRRPHDFLAPDETIRVEQRRLRSRRRAFPNEAALKANAELGRLTVSTRRPARRHRRRRRHRPDPDLRRPFLLDPRRQGNQVFDSGDIIERIVASSFPALFDDAQRQQGRRARRPRPSARSAGRPTPSSASSGRNVTLAFDVTDPADVTFAGAAQHPGDLSPEGVLFISAADSPTGKDLLVTSNEVSNTISVFEVTEAPRLHAPAAALLRRRGRPAGRRHRAESRGADRCLRRRLRQHADPVRRRQLHPRPVPQRRHRSDRLNAACRASAATAPGRRRHRDPTTRSASRSRPSATTSSTSARRCSPTPSRRRAPGGGAQFALAVGQPRLLGRQRAESALRRHVDRRHRRRHAAGEHRSRAASRPRHGHRGRREDRHPRRDDADPRAHLLADRHRGERLPDRRRRRRRGRRHGPAGRPAPADHRRDDRRGHQQDHPASHLQQIAQRAAARDQAAGRRHHPGRRLQHPPRRRRRRGRGLPGPRGRASPTPIRS